MNAQFREVSKKVWVSIAILKIEKVLAGIKSLQIFSETPVLRTLLLE